MHHGSLTTLDDVIEYYGRCGNPNPYLDSELHPLHPSANEKRDLIEFLHSSSGQ